MEMSSRSLDIPLARWTDKGPAISMETTLWGWRSLGGAWNQTKSERAKLPATVGWGMGPRVQNWAEAVVRSQREFLVTVREQEAVGPA